MFVVTNATKTKGKKIKSKLQLQFVNVVYLGGKIKEK
jgi:hypothetical protein